MKVCGFYLSGDAATNIAAGANGGERLCFPGCPSWLIDKDS